MALPFIGRRCMQREIIFGYVGRVAMRYSAAEDQLWHKHGRTVLHPKDAFDDAIRNGMDEEAKYHYMYMYSSETMHFFKHVDTREYARYNRVHRNKR